MAFSKALWRHAQTITLTIFHTCQNFEWTLYLPKNSVKILKQLSKMLWSCSLSQDLKNFRSLMMKFHEPFTKNVFQSLKNFCTYLSTSLNFLLIWKILSTYHHKIASKEKTDTCSLKSNLNIIWFQCNSRKLSRLLASSTYRLFLKRLTYYFLN